MINVIFINCSNIISGAEIALKQYLSSLPRDKIRPYLYIAEDEDILKFFSSSVDYKNIYFTRFFIRNTGFLSRPINLCLLLLETLSVGFKLIFFTKKNKIDIIFCHNTIACVIVGFINFIMKKRLKTVFFVYDKLSTSSFGLLFKLFKDYCDKVVVVSDACKVDLVSFARLSEDKIAVIHNGILIDYSRRLRFQRVEDSSVITIGFAGSCLPRKGLVYLAEAFKFLKNKHLNLRFVLSFNLVEPRYESKVNRILKGVEGIERIRLSPEKMQDFYNAVDILVVPSLIEPLSMVALEALSFGKIVLASNVDGFKDILNDEFLFKPASTMSIISKIEQIIGNFLEYKTYFNHFGPTVADKFSSEKSNNLITGLLLGVATNNGEF